jgi:hypothetical protein
MQPWAYGPPSGEPGMKGWDVIYVGEDGKVKEIYALIEGVSSHSHV